MTQSISINARQDKNNLYLITNLAFSFFPISFIIGNFFINLNLVLFCCLGIFCLKSKILKTEYDFPIKIIFLFFFIIFFSSTLGLLKSLYLSSYDDYDLEKFIKSVLFFRYFLLLIIIYLLNKFDILNFKYFFLIAALFSTLISFDIIFQYIFGLNMIGLKSIGYHKSGFFGDEYIAGGYIQRFAFFAILFTTLLFKNDNYKKFVAGVIVIFILGAGLFLSGNRMPSILFPFGLFLLFFSNIKIRKILFASLVALFILVTFIFSTDKTYRGAYVSFIEGAENTFLTPFDINVFKGPGIQSWSHDQNYHAQENLKGIDEKSLQKTKRTFYTIKVQSGHQRLFLTAFDTWKFNKIFGNGIKSFRVDCHRLKIEQPNLNFQEDIYPSKKSRLCSNHPHNYYFEILTETGIAGLLVISIIALLFVVFIFKNFKFIKQNSAENFILLSAVISLILETFPIKSTGSIFTTHNTTYLILIGSIVLSYKKLLKIN